MYLQYNAGKFKSWVTSNAGLPKLYVGVEPVTEREIN